MCFHSPIRLWIKLNDYFSSRPVCVVKIRSVGVRADQMLLSVHECQSDNTVMAQECLQVALFLSEDLNVLSSYSMTARGRDSSVGTATRYWLDCPGIESRFGRDFANPSRPALVPTQLPIKWVPVLFPGGKAAGPWRWPPTPI
jgi:hypothetical protein